MNLDREGDASRAEREVAKCRYPAERLGRKLAQFPASDDRVLSTRLGNVVRSYEDRSNEILDSHLVATLPRSGGLEALLPFAYFAIPSETRDQHDRFRSQLQANVALLLIVPLVGSALVWAVNDLLWRIGIAAVTVLVMFMARVGARAAADGYGTMLVAIAQQYVAGLHRIAARTPVEAMRAESA